MGSAAVFFSVVTGLVMIAFGAYDFTMPQKVLNLVDRLGHRPNFVRTLGLLKVLGGLGLLVGLVFGFIGVLAALGLFALTPNSATRVQKHFRLQQCSL